MKRTILSLAIPNAAAPTAATAQYRNTGLPMGYARGFVIEWNNAPE